MNEQEIDKKLDDILKQFFIWITENDSIEDLQEATIANMKAAWKAKVLIKEVFKV